MKKLKQNLSLLLAMLMVLLTLGAVPVMAEGAATANEPITAVGDAATVTGTDGKTYTVVRTGDELTSNVQSGNNIIFGNDIDLNGAVLTAAIGNLKSTIDGNGFALVNLSLKNEGGSTGLFNVAKGESAEIRNLNFGTADQLISVSGGNNVGVVFTEISGILGTGDPNTHIADEVRGSAVLENVNVYANVTGTTVVGMFAAYVTGDLTLRNCNTYGSVQGGEYQWDNICGGMIGNVEGSHQNANPHTVLIENCTNYAEVSAVKNNVGGLIGSITVKQNNMLTVTVRNSMNLATVKSDGGSVGGLIGCVFNTETWTNMFTCNFENCVNAGAVSGTSETGGLAGAVYMAQNGSNFTMKFDHCQNTAVITGSANHSGGFMGLLRTGTGSNSGTLTVTDCANLGNLMGSGNLKGGFCGHFENWKASANISYFLNMGKINGNGGSMAGVLAKGNLNTIMDHCVNLGMLEGVTSTSAGIFAIVQNNTTISNCISAGKITKNDESAPIAYIAASLDGGKTLTNSGNLYLKMGDTSVKTDYTSGTLADWQAVAEKLNAEYASHWGNIYFVVNEKGNGLEMLNLPGIVGVQQTKSENGQYNIRLVAVIDTIEYAEVGFRITLKDSATGEVKKSCRTVFTVLRASENGEMLSYTAEQLGGEYIYALTVEGLSDTAAYSFTVTPYALDKDNEEITYTGASYVITYANGTYTGGAPVMPEN